MSYSFQWDEEKDTTNQKKHGISFEEAQYAFADQQKMIFLDSLHSDREKRYFCIARIATGIVTVRFTYRDQNIRIFGAAFWRAGRKNILLKIHNKEKYAKKENDLSRSY